MRFLKKFNLISRLSVSNKFILIYALDLSAVFFVSAILINEKFIAIDFARKEIVGNDYIAALREAAFSVDSTDKAGAGAAAVLAAEDRIGVKLGNTGSRALAQALAEQMRGLQSTASGEPPSLDAVTPGGANVNHAYRQPIQPDFGPGTGQLLHHVPGCNPFPGTFRSDRQNTGKGRCSR